MPDDTDDAPDTEPDHNPEAEATEAGLTMLDELGGWHDDDPGPDEETDG